MCSFKSIYFVIFVLNLYRTYAQISDKRLCADPECKEPLSLAKTLLRYSSPDPRILSFAPNVEATIYSKEAGSETNLWGATIKGKRGYVPKHLVREFKVYKSKPTFLVDTELKQEPQVPKVAGKEDINPDNVKKSYEVVDGTTIYLNPQDTITPSSTESPILATILPPTNQEKENNVPVENSKEEAATKKEPESLLDSMLSSFSDVMNDDDEDSEEIEAEDDEEEDDEDEEEEEESQEDKGHQIEANAQEQLKNVPQDVNSAPSLPPGIKISPYGLEIDKSVNGSGETSNEEELQKSEPLQNSSDFVPKPDSDKEALAGEAENVAQPTGEAVEPAGNAETAKVEINTQAPTEKDETVNVGSEASEKDENSELVEPKNAEKLNQQSEKAATNNMNENIESVTEPSIDTDEEQPPILDDTTTPNPLDQDQETQKTDEVAQEPSQNLEETKNEDLPSTYDDEATDFQTPDTAPSSPDDLIKDQKPLATEEESSSFAPSDNTFNSTQNYVPEGDTEGTSNEATQDEEDQNAKEEHTEAPEVIQEHVSSEISDGSKEDALNSVENEVKGSLPPEDVPASTEETIENNLDKDVNDDKINSENQEIEEINEDQSNVNENYDESVPPEESSVSDDSNGIWSGLFSFFGGSSDDSTNSAPNEQPVVENTEENVWSSQNHEQSINSENYCDATSEQCNTSQQDSLINEYGFFDSIDLKFNSDIFLLLITTAASVIIFLFAYMALDKHRKEAPLIARINKLEKQLLITLKENELLQEKGASALQETETVSNEVVEQLTQKLAEAQFAQQALIATVKDLELQLEAKAALEEQIESLEKELETSTEVGMELNRIISEMLDPTNGSDKLKENVEQFQRQLLEQKDTINSISKTLQEKEAENRALRSDLERSKKIATDLQSKLDEMVDRVLKIEKEKDQQQNTLQNEIAIYQQKYSEAISKEEILNNDIQIIRVQLSEAQRQADMKTKEYQVLKESLDKMKSLKNNSEAMKSLLDSTSIKAEIQQLKAENAAYAAQLQQEQAVKVGFEKKYQAVVEEISLLKDKYERADKEKVEINSKLEVLNNYFKKRESELQEEVIKYKSIWDAKEGEATSTTERIKYLQEEIENYKAQNETLKQEIISQEIDLKSQISMLEKKVHENWVTARQTERKLEDARQEAAQLRNRLTLRERAINEERIQNRLQSPVEQNGEMPLSPHPIDSPASPPLLYGGRDHITKSPPLPGLPPFLPPPPGAPFMPPPLHGMPFMPPPPSMYPGDHRPPPLGRMSSPPLNSRYSPDSSAFSPYDRRSPSPPYDSEYGASPPPMRGYSPYNSRDDRRDYKRPPHGRTNGRNGKGSVMSSGSDHSNDSLDKINRKQSKMV